MGLSFDIFSNDHRWGQLGLGCIARNRTAMVDFDVLPCSACQRWDGFDEFDSGSISVALLVLLVHLLYVYMI